MLCVECLDDETLAWQTISIFAPAQLGKKTVNLCGKPTFRGGR